MLADAKKYLFWGTNPEWYDYDENEQPYLTEEAPDEAKKSFAEYLEIVKKQKTTSVRFV